jgi:hypothetical protein
MVTLVEAEQIQTVLKTIVKIILEGRTTDTAIITALHLQNGNHTGAAWHGAKKIGECVTLCTTKLQSGVILVDFDDTFFTVIPMAGGAKASP